MESSESIEGRGYEQLIQDGIIAVKNGNLPLAKRLLEQAALINNADARIWIWLSATSTDLQERRSCLEKAVAIDPSNATAKRGLLMLIKKLEQSQVLAEGEGYSPQESPAVKEATIKTYTCPNCGASISYDVHETALVCQHCGFSRKINEEVARESTDQPLDAVLPTARAHRWAESQVRVTCKQCGVVILLPAGQSSDICPYCGSTRLISSPELRELEDPQVISPFTIDQQKANEWIKTWLGKGILTPDDLATSHGGLLLQAAYYPFWIFSGTLEVPWFCDVNTGTGKVPRWEPRTGSQFEMFTNILIPGLRKMTLIELTGIEPFNLDDLVEFSPDYLAGWVALAYDHPLADASLRARDKVIQKVRATLPSLVETDHPKRRLNTGVGKWSGLTYKLALLPIYLGNYTFQGQRYHLLINGQTGKVSGNKPVDVLKVAMLSLGAILLLTIIILAIGFLR